MTVVGGAQPSWYRHYVLVVLTLVYVANFVDRQVLNIVLQPIKEEFHVSDSVLGLLAGPTFAVFYAVVGVPLAMAADRFNRKKMIVAALTLFSLMTALCGFVMQFWQLVVARIGTAIGDAGTSPQSHSIIADLYRPSERVGALTVVGIAPFIGIATALGFGGWVSQHYGWRAVFLMAGVPGLILALVVLFTVREPKRGASEDLAEMAAPSLGQTLAFLWRQKSYLGFILGISFGSNTVYAVLAFMPSYLERTFHVARADIGYLMGLLGGVGPGIGAVISGFIIAWLARRDIRWNAWGPLLGMVVSAIMWPLTFATTDLNTTLVVSALPFCLVGIFLGPVYAMAQTLVPHRMRAMSAAVMFFCISIFGLAMGPLSTGILSDVLRPAFGADSLRYALMISPVGSVIAVFCFWLAGRRVRGDLDKLGHAVSHSESGIPARVG